MAFFIRVLGNFDDSSTRVVLQTFSQLIFFVDNVENVAVVDQCWQRDEDNLEDPESDMRDGEGVVITDVLATRLLRVADHFLLFIIPHLQQSEI